VLASFGLLGDCVSGKVEAICPHRVISQNLKNYKKFFEKNKKGSELFNSLPKCYQEEEFLETLTKEIRSPNEECSLISADTRFKLPGVRIKAVVIEVVVIAYVECRSRTRRPTKQRLPSIVSLVRKIINSHSGKNETSKLICGSQAHDIRVKRAHTIVVVIEPALSVIECETKRVDWLVLAPDLGIELPAGNWVLRSARVEIEIVKCVPYEPSEETIVEFLIQGLIHINRTIHLPLGAESFPKNVPSGLVGIRFKPNSSS
jgi:hypothetical protein